MLLLVGLLLVLVKIRLILADDVPFHLLGARANVIKIRVNLGSVQRRDVHTHLVQAEDPAADQGDDQHQGGHQPSLWRTSIGFIAGLLFDSSRLDSVPIPWARKRGVDWRDSSTDGDPTRFDARGGRGGVGRRAG